MIAKTRAVVQSIAEARDEAAAVEAGKAYCENSQHEAKELHAIQEAGTADQRRQNDKYGEQLRAVFAAEMDAMRKLERNPKLRAAFARGRQEAGGGA